MCVYTSEPLWKVAWRFLKKIKTELLYDYLYHFWSYDEQTFIPLERYIYFMFVVALVTIAMEWTETS